MHNPITNGVHIHNLITEDVHITLAITKIKPRCIHITITRLQKWGYIMYIFNEVMYTPSLVVLLCVHLAIGVGTRGAGCAIAPPLFLTHSKTLAIVGL